MPDHRTVRVTITFDIEAAGGDAVGRLARQIPGLVRDLVDGTDGVDRHGTGVSVGTAAVPEDEPWEDRP